MKVKVNKGPFLRDKKTTTKIMLELFITLLVVFLTSVGYYTYAFGILGGLRVFLIGFISILVTIATDVVVALIKKKKTFKDIAKFVLKSYSYVTALIFALCLPAGTSFYVVILGALFATIIGKYVFGGFGNNIFNPAIIGRIFVGLSFGNELKILKATKNGIDVINGATVTGSINWATGISSFVGSNKLSTLQLFLGDYQGAIGETCSALLIAALIYLIIRGIINYRLAGGYLISATLCSFVIGLVYGVNDIGMYLLTTLLTGGLMFAATFMITDPVTSPKSQDGKIIYAFVAGFLAIFIRVFSSYAEGVMFSIALANMLTPLIDGAIKGTTYNKLGKRIAVLACLLVILVGTSAAYTAFSKAKDKENVKLIIDTNEYYLGGASNE